MKTVKTGFVIFCLLVMQCFAYAQNPSNYLIRRVPKDNQRLINTQNPADYLILQSIGQYSNSGRGQCGEGSGIIGTADHFDEDHNVTTCRTGYYFMQQDMAVSIKVEQHTGGDSDRWLLHEVEDGYRRGKELKATYGAPNPIRVIDNNKIWFQWGHYSWLSNNVVVSIDYTDMQGTKPEPLEVVKAYLAKYPSTIALTNDDAKANAHNVQWIKDETDRRLWLCDKWNAQFQAGKTTEKDLLYNLVRSIKVFLNYRQKYFSVASGADLKLLFGYKQNNDIASIQKKLTECKDWWAKHKDKSISLN